MTGEADFSQSRLLVSRLRGELNGGSIDLSGAIRLEGLSFRHYELSSDLKGVSLRIPDTIPSRVSGRLLLTGEADQNLLLSGTLDVDWARYSRSLDVETLVESFRGRAGGAPGGAPAAAPLRMDLQLHGSGDIRVDNDLANLALHGDLRLTGNVEALGLVGTVQSQNGLVEFRGYRYHLSQAIFTFSDPERIAPVFDLSADTDARQYRVFVHVFGTPQDYRVQLRAQPSLTEEDVLKLLTIGVTSQDSVASTGAGRAGYLGDVLWNITGLHDQVRRFIPPNELIKDFNFNLGSAFLESTGQVEPVAQIESRVITDRLRLRAQLPLSEASGKRAQAEYQFSDHLSVQGEWNNDYADYNVGDFGIDLRARWEFGD